MFEGVSSRVNLPKLEEEILEQWRKEDTFRRSVATRRERERFVFYEGPPTANGRPGIHHVLARVFKDVILRYRTMKGRYIPRIAGWDTHGLPVELEVEGKLGLSSKSQIEEYGIDRFNALCRESVLVYLTEWNTLTERIGYWVDLEHPYITMDNSYIETIWWAIKQLWDKDLIYQGYRVTPHCPRCGTSLSSHEVAQGYQEDTEDPSIYIKFKVAAGNSGQLAEITEKAAKPAYLLAWTTTPWTLPGNTALAVAADADYAAIDTGDEIIIMAEARREAAGLGEAEVITKIPGRELTGVAYEPLFNPHRYGVERLRFGENAVLSPQAADDALNYRVITAGFVSMDDGTGIVHIAPAYGEDDYEVGQANQLNFVHHVDPQGNISGTLPGAGQFVKKADPLILQNLDERGQLFRSEKIRHTYPFCWRCDSPLLYYAKETWYIRTTAVKELLLSGNQEINWYPEYIKYGRFGDWLENNVDWAFSRERYWGTPLPVWRCPACGRYECIGSVEELAGKPEVSPLPDPLDLHRPYVDNVSYACPGCSGRMQRVSEVIDCWFDSGAMPIAQHHYPFENETLLTDGRFPADYICEAIDQTRGWFYSLHAIATLLFGRPCFRNVICLGHILDEKGEKMSKTRGNVVAPMSVIDSSGADALRWYCLTASPPGNVRRFSAKLVAEISRRFLLTLWNVYSFFVTYANIDKYDQAKAAQAEPAELDRWIISELNQLILDVDTALDNYNPTDAGRRLETFVDALSNWYVRRSRRRFWKSESDADKMAAYNTLYECLTTLAKLMAPFAPFLAEAIYQNLVRSAFPEAPDSVHLADFPVADTSLIDEQLDRDTQLAMKLSSLGRAARSQAGIKVRQPLSHATVGLSGSGEAESLARVAPQIIEELNVKELKSTDDINQLGDGHVSVNEGGYAVAVPTEISEELLQEGLAREIVHRIQTMRRGADFNIADHIITYYEGDDYVAEVMDGYAAYIKQETLSREIVTGIPEADVFRENYKLAGRQVTLGVRRAD